MPLYEYECTSCHRHTEKIQKFSDPEITTCPYCGGELKRVISAPAFSLKGGGWYADVYGSAKPAAASSGDAPAASAPAGEGSGSGSTPAAPAPTPTTTAPSTSASTPAPAAAPQK